MDTAKIFRSKRVALVLGVLVIAGGVGYAQLEAVSSGVTSLTDYFYGGTVAASTEGVPRYDGETLAAAAAFDVSRPVTGTVQPVFAPTSLTGTHFGMMYSLWQCLGARGVYDISADRIGPVPAMHWLGKPALGYYCPLEDRQVLRTHAAQLRDAGFDFVYVDFTNIHHPTDDIATLTGESALRAMLEEWSKIHGAPKIVPWMPFKPGDDFPQVVDRTLDEYPTMRYFYQGRPLMFVWNQPGTPTDPSLIPMMGNKYTLRTVWFNQADTSNSRVMWSYMSACQEPFKASGGTIECNQGIALDANGNPEQVGVTVAYQRTLMSETGTAVPKFGGKTLAAQFRRLDSLPNIPIVLVQSWNEWIAQRLCQVNGIDTSDCSQPGASERMPNGNLVFNDQYTSEYSRTMEPGADWGNTYYDQLKREVVGRKQSNTQVLGFVDDAVRVGDTVKVVGWACSTGYSTSIPIDVYANGPAGVGQPIVRVSANMENEEAVGTVCGDGWTGVHRFSAALTPADARRLAGQTVYVHGISPVGRDNVLLGHSGEFQFPSMDGAPPVTTAANDESTRQPSDAAFAQASSGLTATTGSERFPLYRFVQNGKHFISASYAEGLAAGFTYEGVAFHASRSPAGGVPIYRCYTGRGNFISNFKNCEGQKYEGFYGYLSASPEGGKQKVYRLYNPTTFDHLATFRSDEGAGVGYHVDANGAAVLGYSD